MQSADDGQGSADPVLTTALSNGFRRRALSMTESQPNVETVIVKAKRAAQSLWMLLHAQVSIPMNFFPCSIQPVLICNASRSDYRHSFMLS